MEVGIVTGLSIQPGRSTRPVCKWQLPRLKPPLAFSAEVSCSSDLFARRSRGRLNTIQRHGLHLWRRPPAQRADANGWIHLADPRRLEGPGQSSKFDLHADLNHARRVRTRAKRPPRHEIEL